MKKIVKFSIIGAIGLSCFTTLILINILIIPYLNPPRSSDDDSGSAIGNTERLSSVKDIIVHVDYAGVKPSKIVEDIELYDEKTTAFYATDAACDIDGYGFPDNAYIEEIDGVQEDDANSGKKNYYWIYYVNGEKAAVGCSSYNLVDGDEITWNYEYWGD